MKTNQSEYLWALGPTTCAPQPKILKSIARQIKAKGIVSEHELRIARRMGIVSVEPTSARLGFNDGVIYPFDEPAAAGARARAMARPGLAKAPARKRKMHALALLVDFSDSEGVRPAKDFEKLLFEKSNPNSMTNFYKKLSYGAIEVTGEAVGYVHAPQPYSFYTANESGTGTNFPRNTPGLLRDALTVFCQNDNLERFDTDGDGYVDGIFLIHAGGGAEAEPNATKRKNMIWSHKWTMPQPFVN
ncbi:MAG: immune inhibitor A [Chthoniobacterales bacterium]|nr:immune inhibitor A [Chthoniobacterales bacterium]